MNATIDGYTQVYIGLDSTDVEFLERTGVVYGTIWRTDQKEFPFSLKLGKEWRTRGIGPSYEQKIGYEIYAPADVVERLRRGAPSATGIPTTTFRSVYVCNEQV